MFQSVCKRLSSFFIVTFFSPVHFCEQHNIALPVFWQYRKKKPPSVSFSRRGRLFGTKPLILSLSHKKSQQDMPENALTSSFDAATTTEGRFFFVPPVPKSGVFGVGGGGVRAKKKLRVFCDFSPCLQKRAASVIRGGFFLK